MTIKKKKKLKINFRLPQNLPVYDFRVDDTLAPFSLSDTFDPVLLPISIAKCGQINGVCKTYT